MKEKRLQILDSLSKGEITSEQADKELLFLFSVSNRRELLCAFFKYFRDNGEANIGMTIEEFVDGFLSAQ